MKKHTRVGLTEERVREIVREELRLVEVAKKAKTEAFDKQVKSLVFEQESLTPPKMGGSHID